MFSRWLFNALTNIFACGRLSTENCLGQQETRDHNYPICVEELIKHKVVDVGCGIDYTVAVVTDQSNSVAYENYKAFSETIFQNAKEKIGRMKIYFNTLISDFDTSTVAYG